jgi:hypothetical protein
VPGLISREPQLGIVVLAWLLVLIEISWSPLAWRSNSQSKVRSRRVSSQCLTQQPTTHSEFGVRHSLRRLPLSVAGANLHCRDMTQ